MKLKECKNCYYAGIKKCFLYNKSFEELKIKECKETFYDPYEERNTVDETCKTCWFYQNKQCTGTKWAKITCIKEL